MKKSFVLLAVFSCGQSYFEPIIAVFASPPTEEQKEAALLKWMNTGSNSAHSEYHNMITLEVPFYD